MPSDRVGFLPALRELRDLWGLALVEAEFPLPHPLLRKGRGGSKESPLGKCCPGHAMEKLGYEGKGS